MKMFFIAVLIVIVSGCAINSKQVQEDRHQEVTKRLDKLESYMGWLIGQYRDHNHPYGPGSFSGRTVVPQCSSNADCTGDSNCVCDFGSGVCACVASPN
ncbi:hypothetical protein GCM10007941_33370 [Amphritea balenae]|nr:hypothetical protein GCM10007941_33370 [Amphritea balenae]